MTTKADARAEGRARRRAIPPEERLARAARIHARVLDLPEVRGARVVAAYASVHSEVDTRALLPDLRRPGRALALPVLLPGGMRLAEADPAALVPGPHGIPEPPPPHRFLDNPDVVLVPGILFTPEGHRLGNGGGHYDRLLAATPRAVRVALAFEEQVVPFVPREPHDARMHVVVTDARVLRVAT